MSQQGKGPYKYSNRELIFLNVFFQINLVNENLYAVRAIFICTVPSFHVKTKHESVRSDHEVGQICHFWLIDIPLFARKKKSVRTVLDSAGPCDKHKVLQT